ncbi:Protein CBG25728 [Caenorhabditis briggsae]|uniref:Protein CBG25728 n=1 Tax=Caenorhabditis briggsae TaxID=6238 RepID=B6IGZ1_CAEBR|nr:Protein CBG25728 [Caenorhabditis briggsae]CAR99171.1 Protein CBG25728 [Caenorhabditis briggsae]
MEQKKKLWTRIREKNSKVEAAVVKIHREISASRAGLNKLTKKNVKDAIEKRGKRGKKGRGLNNKLLETSGTKNYEK